MSNVRIVAEDGAEYTVTMLTLSRRVPDDAFFDILTDPSRPERPRPP